MNHPALRAFECLTLILAAAGAGCAGTRGSPAISLRAAPDGVGLEEAAESGFDLSAGPVDLVAAGNETVALRLWATHEGLLPAEVNVTADDWRGPDEAVLPSNSVQLYRVYPVRVVRWPGWRIRLVEPHRRESVEDVLVPAYVRGAGLPCTLSKDETLALWVDVHVPPDAQPGVYLTDLRLRSGQSTAATVPLRLEVLPWRLPPAGIVVFGELDHEALFAHHVTHEGRPYRPGRVFADSPVRSELQAVIDSTVELLQSHQVSPVLPGLRPAMKIDAGGEVAVRWEDYDGLVAEYLDGTRFPALGPLPVWLAPFDETFPTPPSRETVQSPAYSGYVRQYLARCAEHFAERGWLDRSFVRIPHARVPGAEAIAASEHFGKLIRQAAPGLRTLSELFPQDMSPYGWTGFPAGDLLGYVDVWCPPAQFYPTAHVRDGLVPSQTFWMQVDRPPFSGSLAIAANGFDARVIPWQARQERAAGVRLGPLNAWPEAGEHRGKISAQDCIDHAASGEGIRDPLIYPGSVIGHHQPLASVRLKRLRRGMHDLAWLQLLKERGAGHIAEVLAESLAPFAGGHAYRHHYADGRPGGWVTDPKSWREAEGIMLDELRAALAGPPGRVERMASAVRWGRFMEAVRRPMVEVESVRVLRVARGERAASTLQCALVIRNAAREPVSGTAQFGGLPVGWKAGDEAVSYGPVPPGGAARVQLSAAATAVAWNEDGVQYFPIELSAVESGPKTPERVSARLAYVAAQPLGARPAGRPSAKRSIRIDGDLADWPAAGSNLASDFVLITGEDPAAPGEPRTRPRGNTRVSVAVDSEALYFGFECVAPGGIAELSAAGHSNTVRYQDLVPVGDELVEMVLDPSAAGTHSPEDLYHIAVKPGGAMWERGVSFEPPVGRREVWPVDVQHAAKVQGERWTAEVRIPLGAFGQGALRQPVWAVNFARFDARHQEYSTWSGATGDFYDPAAMGNLALP